MASTTVARLIFDSIVPEKYRADLPPDQPIGSKEVKDILQQVAEQDPDKYRDISFKLLRLGSKGAVETGSSFSMNDLASPIDKDKLMDEVSQKERGIFGDKGLDQDKREQALVKLYDHYSNKMPGMIFDASMAKGSNLARMVASGARGNKAQLNSNIGSDFLVVDQNNKPVPIGIKNSYTEGLNPAEYFAASYGTRAGLISTKFSTMHSGFLSKQLNSSMLDLIVTQHDCGTKTGIPVDIDDGDNIGSVLAKDTSGHKAGTLLTSKIIGDIKKSGKDRIVVRSTLTCESPNGICAKCAGTRERGGFPALGEAVGLSAGSSASEPLSQMQLSKKHCLSKGTLVRMADWTTKEIQDVRTGDFVLGSDINGNTFPSEVLNVFDNGNRVCQRYTFSINNLGRTSVVCTADHKILSRWYKSMCAGDDLNWTNQVLPIGTKTNKFYGVLPMGFTSVGLRDEPFDCVVDCRKLRRVGIEEMGSVPTFDIEVGHPDHLFVLANGLVVSNSAGVANSSKATGFKAINALFQVPDTFPDKASLSEHDGQVDKIETMPQGGFNVSIGGHKHYVSPDHQVLVKHGDKLEAGDRISTGTINPSDVVRLKGIGAGRLNLLKQVQDTFSESGIPMLRRNAEVLVRGIVDHVRINDSDETNSYLPDETVEYSAFSKDYKPHRDSVVMHPTKALNHYLEAPVMHYSIGTRITPSVAKNLGDMGEDQVLVSHHKPAFEPHMVRLMENPSHDKDWMSQMGTSYVQKNLKKNVISGDVYSDIHGTNPIPALAYGKEFGKPPKGTVGY